MKKYIKEMITYVLWFTLFLVLSILISGCAALKAADDLYNTPCYRGEDKTDPYDIASFYASNYPDVSNDEKADMLYQRLLEEKWEATIEIKETVIKEKVVTWSGRRLWPIDKVRMPPRSIDEFMKETSDNLKKLKREQPTEIEEDDSSV